MELINLKEMRESLTTLPNLTKEDRKALWLIFKRTRESNRQEIVKAITENELIESELLENGALICNGWGEINKVCCVVANINDSEICLFEDFTMRIGSHMLTINFKGVKIYEIEIESISSFRIRWGC